MKNSFSNYEIVTLAVYLLGGDLKYVDTEDVAVKTNRIAPGRFVWHKYPDQINIENVRTSLSDAKKPKNGKYLVGTGKDGWCLTKKGLEFAQQRVTELEQVDLSRDRLTQEERRWYQFEYARMLSSTAFLKFKAGKEHDITKREVESFFRVDDYIVGEARQQKIERILNIFGDDPELGEVVQTVSKQVERK